MCGAESQRLSGFDVRRCSRGNKGALRDEIHELQPEPLKSPPAAADEEEAVVQRTQEEECLSDHREAPAAFTL